MVKIKSIYRCGECGATSPKWMGRCNDCGAWNAMEEEHVSTAPSASLIEKLAPNPSSPVPIKKAPLENEFHLPTGDSEFDRVLGGGIVKGGVVLIGGDPGIGKSTLMLQAGQRVARGGHKALYVTGEESAAQTRMRAERLGSSADSLFVLTETFLPNIFDAIKKVKPMMIVVDSIQTMYSDSLQSAPGSVGQVREVAAFFVRLAKSTGIAVFLVGHVTKSGAIAGPRVIEHLVDTVLYFEGEGSHTYRILRAVKNRFGSTNEIGVFEMRREGLIEVENPSELFLSERAISAAGTAVAPCLEGARPILVEVQALVTPTSYGTPQRTTQGIERGRLALLIAVLEKRVGLALGTFDVFLNIAGGLRIAEPAADLAIAAAISSSHRDAPLDSATMYFGEIGLAGEIRAVAGADVRLAEGVKLGFKKCVLPATCAKRLKPPRGMELLSAHNLIEAI